MNSSNSDWCVWPPLVYEDDGGYCCHCGWRRRISGDWLCAACRRELESRLRRFAPRRSPRRAGNNIRKNHPLGGGRCVGCNVGSD
jgi:hypothetical protein